MRSPVTSDQFISLQKNKNKGHLYCFETYLHLKDLRAEMRQLIGCFCCQGNLSIIIWNCSWEHCLYGENQTSKMALIICLLKPGMWKAVEKKTWTMSAKRKSLRPQSGKACDHKACDHKAAKLATTKRQSLRPQSAQALLYNLGCSIWFYLRVLENLKVNP